MREPLFIAHRGAPLPSRRANSLNAITRSLKSGRFMAIEVDVRRTRTDDNDERELVIAHDGGVDELYESQRIPLYKRKYSARQISSLTYDMLNDEHLEVARLGDVLRIVDNNLLNIEIKDPTIVSQLVEELKERMALKTTKLTHQDILISSFERAALFEIKKLDPKLRVAIVYGLRSTPQKIVSDLKKLQSSTVVVSKWLAPVMVPWLALRKVQNRWVYTVNNRFAVFVLRLFGANGFFTDRVNLPK